MSSPTADSGALARRFLRGGAYLGIAQYAGLAIGLIKAPILARLVAPEIWGIVGLAAVWVSFLSVFRMELREIVISAPEDNQARLVTQYVIEVLTALAGVGLMLALFGAARGILSLPHWQAIFTLMGVRLITALTSTPLYILHRDIRQGVITRLTLLGTLIGLAASLTLAFLGYPLLSLLLDAAIPVVVLGVGAWLVVGWRPRPAWDAAIARDIASFGLTLWTSGILGKITFEFDDWLVGSLRGSKALGYYGKAYWLAKLPMDVFAGVIGGIALSMYAQSAAAGRAILARAYGLTTWLLSRIIALSSIVMLAAAEEIVWILLGPRWQPVPLLLRLMFVYVLGRPIFQNNAQLLIAVRQEKQFRTTMIVQAVLLIVICPPLVWFWGVWGAAVAVSVMSIPGVILSQWYVSRQITAPVLPLYGLPLLLVLVITPLLVALGQLVGGSPLVTLLFKGALACVLFALVTALGERARVREAVTLIVDNLGAALRGRAASPPAAE